MVKCGFCKVEILYPPIEVPIGPIEWEADQEVAKAGLSRMMGSYDSVKSCLPCARVYLARIDVNIILENRCTTSPIKRPKIRRLWWKLFSWGTKSYECPECLQKLTTNNLHRHLYFCFFCGQLLENK